MPQFGLDSGYQWYLYTQGINLSGKLRAMTLLPTTRRRRTRAESAAETRERLLEAAETVIRHSGYHGASLDEVAAVAGFTKGAVYAAFDSKADLFLALLARRTEARIAEFHAVLAQVSDPAAAVVEVARRFATTFVGERDWWTSVIEFMTVVARSEPLRARYAVHHDASREAIAGIFEHWALERGLTLGLPPRQLGTLALALWNGLTLEALIAPAEVPCGLFVDAQLALLRGTTVTPGPPAWT